MRFGGTESAERFMAEQRWPRDQYVIEQETKNAVEHAREALANAQRNERMAAASRQAGRITKSCHREHVRVRIECEQRLQDALRDAAPGCECDLREHIAPGCHCPVCEPDAPNSTFEAYPPQPLVTDVCEQCGDVFAGPTCVDCSDGD